MTAFIFVLVLETGEIFSKTYDTRGECAARLRIAARSEGVDEGFCMEVPWRKA